MKRNVLLLFAIVAVLLSACGGQNTTGSDSDDKPSVATWNEAKWDEAKWQ